MKLCWISCPRGPYCSVQCFDTYSVKSAIRLLFFPFYRLYSLGRLFGQFGLCSDFNLLSARLAGFLFVFVRGRLPQTYRRL